MSHQGLQEVTKLERRSPAKFLESELRPRAQAGPPHGRGLSWCRGTTCLRACFLVRSVLENKHARLRVLEGSGSVWFGIISLRPPSKLDMGFV